MLLGLFASDFISWKVVIGVRQRYLAEIAAITALAAKSAWSAYRKLRARLHKIAKASFCAAASRSNISATAKNEVETATPLKNICRATGNYAVVFGRTDVLATLKTTQ
jgi:tRNA C32,U32 (ribose-2'-O)-methylase TrmJ